MHRHTAPTTGYVEDDREAAAMLQDPWEFDHAHGRHEEEGDSDEAGR